MLTLPEKYFHFGEIVLPGLDEKIKLPRRTWFRYDGKIKEPFSKNIAKTELLIRNNLVQYHSTVAKILNWPLDNLIIAVVAEQVRQRLGNLDDNCSYCYRHHVNNDPAYVIAKKKNLPLNKSIFADGYQSGHLLSNLQMEQTLHEILAKHNITLDITNLSPQELGDLGGLLALRKSVSVKLQTRLGIKIPSFTNREPINPEFAKLFGF
jgi:hypothetical protein